MNYYCSPENVLDAEAACFYCQVGIAVAVHQRRQIPGVERVRCFCWIVVAQCVGKVGSRAAIPRVDMEAKEACISVGQTVDGSLYQNAILKLNEAHLPTQLGVGSRATDDRHSPEPIRFLLHILTSKQYMQSAVDGCVKRSCADDADMIQYMYKGGDGYGLQA